MEKKCTESWNKPFSLNLRKQLHRSQLRALGPATHVNSQYENRSARDASKFLSLFDGLAMLLHENLFASGVEPKVYVARNINPKLVGGEKLQSAMLYMLLS